MISSSPAARKSTALSARSNVQSISVASELSSAAVKVVAFTNVAIKPAGSVVETTVPAPSS